MKERNSNNIFDNEMENEDIAPLNFFSDQLSSKVQKTQELARDIFNLVMKEAPVGAALIKEANGSGRYVLDISKKTYKEIEKGTIKLVEDGLGNITSQYRNSDGKFGDKIPLKKETLGNMDFMQLTNTMQLQDLQAQLEKIASQLNVIDISVKRVVEGQQSDRIAGFESGRSLYLESLAVRDESMQMQLKGQAIKSLSDASSQLRLTMQSDIDFLKSKGYQAAKGAQAAQIDERMNNIHRSFEGIHNAVIMKAGIYFNEEEYSAMKLVINDYSSFIEQVITENANLLSQWDKTDDGTDVGIWKTRATLKLDRVFQQTSLDNTKEFYISMLAEEDSNEND